MSFEEKGKCVVSGHHIAFDSRPKVEQLCVGTRVVVRCQNNKFRFRPGILAELPSRKNQFRFRLKEKTLKASQQASSDSDPFSVFGRFLVFVDDHTPVYVGLPLFHLVCRPCEFKLFSVLSRSSRLGLKDQIVFSILLSSCAFETKLPHKLRNSPKLYTCQRKYILYSK